MYYNHVVNTTKHPSFNTADLFETDAKGLLLKVYDYAIFHCRNKDMQKTNEAIGVLINALDFDVKEGKDLAVNLLRLYQYSQEQVRIGNYQIVEKILFELRETWESIEVKN